MNHGYHLCPHPRAYQEYLSGSQQETDGSPALNEETVYRGMGRIQRTRNEALGTSDVRCSNYPPAWRETKQGGQNLEFGIREGCPRGIVAMVIEWAKRDKDFFCKEHKHPDEHEMSKLQHNLYGKNYEINQNQLKHLCGLSEFYDLCLKWAFIDSAIKCLFSLYILVTEHR